VGSAEEVPEQVRFSPRLRWLLRALGMGPKRTGLVLTPYEVRVKAGGFQTTVPLDHIVAVSECPAPWWAQAGVHTDFRGRWIINGGPGRLVRLGLSPSVEARILGMRLPVRRLDVGLEDNAGFLARLSELRKSAGE
jgi:hypothetical protein